MAWAGRWSPLQGACSLALLFGCFIAYPPLVLPQAGPNQAPANRCLRKSGQPLTFEQARADARRQDACERSLSLIAVKSDNPNLIWRGDEVLVLAWSGPCRPESSLPSLSCMEEGTWARIQDKATDYTIWVTLVPELRDFLRRQPRGSTINALRDRLKKHLGLELESSYDWFVEIWVDKKYLIRPCHDTSIANRSCQLIPEGKAVDPRLQRARNSKWPFTGLGYTYDWGNPVSDIGASEFVIDGGARFQIGRRFTTADYIQNVLSGL
jgi:hypothetical protein